MTKLFFDLYGTLVDSSGRLTVAANSIVQNQGLSIEPQVLVDSLIKHFSKQVWHTSTFRPMRDWYRIAIEDSYAELGLEGVDEAHEIYCDTGTDIQPMPFMLEILNGLAESHSLGILSNIDDQDLEKILERYPIPAEMILTSEEARCYKPNRGVFFTAMEKFDLEPSEIVYIGDRANIDVVGARRVGWRTVLVGDVDISRLSSSKKPDAHIRSLSDLPALLEKRSSEWGLSSVELSERIMRLKNRVPEHVVKRIFSTTRSRVKAERRRVTVLFADMVGFTRMCEDMDAEEMTGLLDEIFELMADAVRSNNGFIDKFIGDCGMAVFGAPVAYPHDCVNAVKAAIQIRDGIREFSKKMGLAVPLMTSSGIATGLAVAGDMGTNRKLDYTVIGDAVNLAARLQSVAKEDEILIDAETYYGAGGVVGVGEERSEFIKGKKDEQVFYGVQSVNAGSEQDRSRDLIIGREDQIEQIRNFISEKSDSARFLLVSGETGTGKSLLLGRAAEFADANTYRSFKATCLRDRAAAPLQPLATLLMRIKATGLENDTEQPEEQRILIDVIRGTISPTEAGRVAATSEEQFFAATISYLRQVSEQMPLVLIIDDYQWSDSSTRRFMDFASNNSDRNKVIFVVAVRETEADMKIHQDQLALRLPMFEIEQVMLLAQHLLPDAVLKRESAEVLLEKSGGNPFFLSELMRHALRLNTTDFDNLPGSLSGAIVAQVDELADREKNLIHAASVLGQSFPMQMLEAIAVEEKEFGATLRLLQDEGLIVKDGRTRYRFRNGLIQTSVYDTILLSTRRELHSQAVDYLIRKYDGSRISKVEQLAFHHEMAGNDEQAARCRIESGEEAEKLFGWEGALQHYEAAEKLQASDGTTARGRLFLKIAGPLNRLGNYDRSLEFIDKALEVFQQHGDIPFEIHAHSLASTVWMKRRDYKKGSAIVQKCISMAESNSMEGLLPMLHNRMGYVYLGRGDLKEAREHLETGIRRARELEITDFVAGNLEGMGRIEMLEGNGDAAVQHLEAAIEAAQSLDEEAKIAGGLAEAYETTGNMHQALELSEKAVELNRRIYRDYGLMFSCETYARILAKVGKNDLAQENFDEAMALAKKCEREDIQKRINETRLEFPGTNSATC